MKMKFNLMAMLIGGALLSSITMSSCNSNESTGGKAELTNFGDSVAYALGYYIAYNNMEQGWAQLDAKIVGQAMQAFYDKGDSNMIFDKESAINMLNENGRRSQLAKQSENETIGKAFLEANKTKEGVVTLPSGLQYKILEEGTGPKPAPGSKVEVHYTGTFIDGKIFDSSRGSEPVSFGLNNVIKGWGEALPLMNVGTRCELYVPSELAYGPTGDQGIPPSSTLIFDIELLSIVADVPTENNK